MKIIDFDTPYFLLNVALLLIYVVAGWRISKTKGFWGWASVCVIAFTLVEGLRYGRGNDYMHYTEVFSGLDIQADKTFIFLNSILAEIGFTKYSCFMFYSFTFALCGAIFMKDYKQYAKWLFPLFLVANIIFSEYQIRQAFSYSFFFLYMKYLLKIPRTDIFNIRKYKYYIYKCLFWGILCLLLHSANIINIVIFTILYLFAKKTIPYFLSIPIYVLCVYVFPNFFDMDWMKLVFDILPRLDVSKGYVENFDVWFSEEAKNEIYTRNEIVQIVETIGVSSLLYLANKTDEVRFPGASVFYNSFFIGVCVLSMFREIELFNRIGANLMLVWFLLVTMVWSIKSYRKGLYRFVCSIFLVWFFYDYLKYLFIPGNMVKFIWDAPLSVSFF